MTADASQSLPRAVFAKAVGALGWGDAPSPLVWRRFRFYQQQDDVDCASACLRMVARHHGRQFGARQMRELCDVGRHGASVRTLTRAAEAIGLRTLAARIPTSKLHSVPLPCVLHWEQRHFVVLLRSSGRKFVIADPAVGIRKVERQKFEESWLQGTSAGVAVFFDTTPRFFEVEESEDSVSGTSLGVYATRYRGLLFQVGMGLLFSGLVALALPFLTQTIVDSALTAQDVSFVYLVGLAYFAMICGKVVIDLIRMRLVLHIGHRVSISMISDFLAKMLSLPVAFFGTRRLSDILERIADHKRIETLIAGSGIAAAFAVVQLAVLTLALCIISAKIALIFALAAALAGGWVALWLPLRRRMDQLCFAETARAQGQVIQMVSGIVELKLHDCEMEMRHDWERRRISLFGLALRSMTVEQIQLGGLTFISESANIAIIVSSVLAVLEGQITLGMLLATTYIVGQMNVPLREVLLFTRTFQDAKIAMERAADVHQATSEQVDSKGLLSLLPEEAGLRLEGVSFRYPGADAVDVLSDISCEIPAGKLTAIVGTSGSGKSTLVRLLLRLYEPTRGVVTLNGVDLRNYALSTWRKAVGTVLQDGYLFEGTFTENIALGSESVDSSLMQRAIQVSNFADVLKNRPLGLSTKVGPNGDGLSQGQKQRLLIARAIYKRPRLFVFDEATSALDANNERKIVERLDEVFSGRTAIVVAHRLSTVRHADNILVLANGRIAESGTHAQLVEKRGAYYELVRNQLELEA